MDSLQPTSHHTRLCIGHALMAGGVFVFLCLSLLLSAVSSVTAVAFGASVISDLSNSARNSNGLASLTINSKLTTAAQNKANAMVANNYFEHTAPDGTSGWSYISSAGYSYLSAGENLAASNEDDASVVNGWLNSPTHRNNLLSSTYTEVGYGISYIGDYSGYAGVYFVVALYAQPQVVVSKPNPAPAPAAVVSPQPTTTENSTPAVVDDNPKPVEVTRSKPQKIAAIENEPAGIKTLRENRFAMNRQLSFGLLTLGTTLSVGGIAVETRRLFKHPRSWRHNI